MLGGDHSNPQMNDYEKFSMIQPSKMLEENLMLTIDKNEVLFQVAQEHQSQLSTRFISIDLVQKKFKIWSPNFDACVLTKKNPFTMHNLHKAGLDKAKA